MKSREQRAESKNTDKKSKSDLKSRSYIFGLNIIKLIDDLPNEKACWVISDQLLRSATSIGANVVEAQAASSKRDFVNFFNYALKSANETKFWLGLLKDSGKMDRKRVNNLLQEVNEFSNILGASILTAKGKRKF